MAVAAAVVVVVAAAVDAVDAAAAVLADAVAAVDSAAEEAVVDSAAAAEDAAGEAEDSEDGADFNIYITYIFVPYVFFSRGMHDNGKSDETVETVKTSSIVAFKGAIEDSIDLAEPYRTVTQRYYTRENKIHI